MSPGDEERRPGGGGATSSKTGEDVPLTLTDRTDSPWNDFADGYRMGWHAGYDAGIAIAEAEMAEAWMAEVHRIRALARPDDYMARVRAAERHCRALAERQWLSREAWESAAAQGMTEEARRKGVTPLFPDGDTLARAMGVKLPRRRRPLPGRTR